MIVYRNLKIVMVIKSIIPVGYTASVKKIHCDNIIFNSEIQRESKALYANVCPTKLVA